MVRSAADNSSPNSGGRASVSARLPLIAAGLLVIALAMTAALGSMGLVPRVGALHPGSGPSVPPNSPTPSPANGSNTSTTFPGPQSGNCNAIGSPTPSSLLIPTANPSVSLGSGGSLTAGFEVGVVNYSSTNAGTRLILPSVFATFPLSGGSSYQVYLPARTIYVNASGWSSPSLGARTVQPSAGLTFSSSASAVLSTQKIAVMTAENYSAVTMELRWSWTLHQPDGTLVNGTWTTPSRAAHWPSQLPSIFYPAPFASLLSTGGSTVTIGTNFTATLGGMVSARYFFLELEYPGTGKVVQAHGQTAASSATTFVVTILMLNYDHYLSPGTYLVHIHDGCGAMLYSLSEKAVFASSATVRFYVNPSSCGAITFNGSSYASGTSATVVPSTTAYSLAISGCKGHTFQAWGSTGAVHVSSGSGLLVSGSGTFTVKYS